MSDRVPKGDRLYQIHGADLRTVEDALERIEMWEDGYVSGYVAADVRKIRQVIDDVRRDYEPHSDVEVIKP